MVGAVLTQNTAWVNAERAVARLRCAAALDPAVIDAMPATELATRIRPAGCFNVKATRLKALVRWLLEQGGLDGIDRQATTDLRQSLVGVHGIGPETADAILLYALKRPVFVVDTYTFRIFARAGIIPTRLRDYEAVRGLVEATFPGQTGLFNEFHALLVAHGKHCCRPSPRCDDCCLAAHCAHSTGRNCLPGAT
ncbi:MAG: endonuclease [Pseudomonadota bacterium]|nr:MAG: endonuclease [Pseudomonadota bacterium]